MKSVELIVFDMDDTLYLERDYVRSGFKAVDAWLKKSQGVAGFFECAWRIFEQGTRGIIFDEALKQLGLRSDAALIQNLIEVYRTHTPQIDLAADAQICLRHLRGWKRTALISDGALQSQRAKAQALALGHWIEYLLLTDELGSEYKKPHKKSFETVQKHFNVAADRCLYVADNPSKDFIAPRALAWHTVRVSRSGGLYSQLPDSDVPDEVLPDLSALPQLLKLRD
jgi:putative hydrolase of the HAD superfamily